MYTLGTKYIRRIKTTSMKANLDQTFTIINNYRITAFLTFKKNSTPIFEHCFIYEYLVY